MENLVWKEMRIFLSDLRQSESEVRLFGVGVPLRAGKGKGSGTVGFGNGGLRSEIGGVGVGGPGVGGSVGTLGEQLCIPEVGERTSILFSMSLKSVPTSIDNTFDTAQNKS